MQQLEQLKCRSLQLVEDMPVKWSGSHEITPLKVSNILKTIQENKVYAYTSKVIVFVCQGKMYVTPYSTQSLKIVRDAGFKLREFFVPFSRGDLPQGEYGEKWSELIARLKPNAVIPATAASL